MVESAEEMKYDLEEEIMEFEESKAGVKGLVDSGILKIPHFFYNFPTKFSPQPTSNQELAQLQVPVIDLSHSNHPEIIDQVRAAAKNWGFFQVINHCIPVDIMEQLLEATHRFHEQPAEIKRSLYSLDPNQSVRFASNTLLRASKHADWRDSLFCDHHDGVLDPETIPLVCRKAVSNYMGCLMELRENISQLLSEALGLDTNYLSSMECVNTANLVCHYYPPCPEPEKTMGATKHSDPSFFTIVIQDQMGGLQVFNENQWIDVPPTTGALVINIGDMMQLITNGKFKSSQHRVLVSKTGPRKSAPCFFYPSTKKKHEPYRPLKELIVQGKEEAIYKEVSAGDYLAYYKIKGVGGNHALPHFMIIK